MYCASFYCAPLWNHYKAESVRRFKVAYNRIFRILLGFKQRVNVSHELIVRGLNPFIVIARKQTVSFKRRLLHTKNSLVKTIVDSLYFVNSKLVKKWDELTCKF